MAGNKSLELTVGTFILVGIVAMIWLALRVGNLSGIGTEDSYHIIAKFDNIGQLKVKAPITIGGVLVGRVSKIHIDDNFYAVTTLDISSNYNNLPKDTSATILTAGLLGEQYISLEPGGDDESLVTGDELIITQSAFILEKIISQFLYSKAEDTAK